MKAGLMAITDCLTPFVARHRRKGQPPAFYVWAAGDPDTHNLQRLQIIKGWVQDGEPQEAVIDVACSDGLAVDPETNRCPDNGAQVNLSDCSVTPGKGAAELPDDFTASYGLGSHGVTHAMQTVLAPSQP